MIRSTSAPSFCCHLLLLYSHVLGLIYICYEFRCNIITSIDHTAKIHIADDETKHTPSDSNYESMCAGM